MFPRKGANELTYYFVVSYNFKELEEIFKDRHQQVETDFEHSA